MKVIRKPEIREAVIAFIPSQKEEETNLKDIREFFKGSSYQLMLGFTRIMNTQTDEYDYVAVLRAELDPMGTFDIYHGDWIVKFPDGSFTVVPVDVFHAIYDIYKE